jgi:hypothetical protein
MMADEELRDGKADSSDSNRAQDVIVAMAIATA